MGKIRSPGATQGKRLQTGLQEEAPDLAPPKFSFRYLQSEYCISKCNRNEKLSFLNKMLQMSQVPWARLRQAPRHGIGYETIKSDCLRANVPEKVAEDVTIIAFRFHDRAPMVGFRGADGTFYIIWFDREHKLYDHG